MKYIALIGCLLGIAARGQDTTRLKEIVIQATPPPIQQTAAGAVINPENNPLSKGSSVLFLLETSPGIVIDHYNQNISLNGKGGVEVMINGKPTHLGMGELFALLNGLSADQVQRIELLTTPPASYDAQGSAGLINIVLKRGKKPGNSGSVSLTGGYGWREKATGSLSASRNTGRLELYATYTFSHDHTISRSYITSAQDMPLFGGPLNTLVWDTTRRKEDDNNATAGVDFHITPRTTIGAGITFNSSNASLVEEQRQWFHLQPDSLLWYNGNINGVNHWSNGIFSAYVTHRQLEAGVDYLYFTNDNPSNIQSLVTNAGGKETEPNDSLFAPGQRIFAHTTIHVVTGKIDYTRPLSKAIRWASGIKATYTRDSARSGIDALIAGVWTPRDETAAGLTMREGIGAAYTTFDARPDSATTLVAGLRYEYSRTTLNVIDRRLGAFFPSLLFTRKLSARSSVEVSYSKRISRPSYNDLAAFTGYSGPNAVYTGNPFLQPTITHNAKVAYRYRRYAFSLLLSRDENPIARYQLTESPSAELLFISPQNMAWQNNIALDATLPLKVNRWWDMDADLTGGWRQFKENYTPYPAEKSYWTGSLHLNQSFRLPGRWTVGLTGWYNSMSYNGTTGISGMGALGAGIKKELGGNRGNLQLSVTNLLTSPINVQYGTVTEEAFDVKNHVQIYTEPNVARIYKLTYTRSFGGGDAGKRRGTPDEEIRIGVK